MVASSRHSKLTKFRLVEMMRLCSKGSNTNKQADTIDIEFLLFYHYQQISLHIRNCLRGCFIVPVSNFSVMSLSWVEPVLSSKDKVQCSRTEHVASGETQTKEGPRDL